MSEIIFAPNTNESRAERERYCEAICADADADGTVDAARSGAMALLDDAEAFIGEGEKELALMFVSSAYDLLDRSRFPNKIGRKARDA